MKAIRKITLWLIMLLYLGLVFGFVSNRYESLLCNKLEVNIQDSLKTGFLKAEDIEEILDSKNIKYLGRPLYEIDLDEIEQAVKENQLINTCKVFTCIDGVLNIELNQRDPFVRLIDNLNQSYYLDREGNVLNGSKRFTPHVLIVSGKIKTPFQIGGAVNVTQLKDEGWDKKMKEIYELSMFITSNPFWNAQIEQVYLNQNGEYELVPRIGPHIIILGEIDDYVAKFKKLEIFYKEGLNRVGWNQYVKINLKYKNQVVCTKI